MGHLLRRRPSAAMVVAIAALIVAMSGTAVAASSLVKGDSLIKKNSLSGNRLRNHTVTGKQIKVSSLGTVPSATNATNAVNAANAASASISKVTYASSTTAVPANSNGTSLVTTSCPSGTVVTGGGAVLGNESQGSVNDSYPSSKTQWSADVYNFGGNSGTAPLNVTVGAICVPAAATAP